MEALQNYHTKEGREQLVRSLQLTDLVSDVREIAEDLAKRVDLATWDTGDLLMVQDADDNDLYFILAGQVQILVDDHEVALLGAGSHVGELALIDPRAYRSASVVATRETTTAKLSQVEFVEVANKHPELWRRMAQILGDRLRDQNRFLLLPNPRPLVFLSFADRELGNALLSRLQSEKFLLKSFQTATGEEEFPRRAFAHAIAHVDVGIIVRAPGDLSQASPHSRDVLHFLCGASVGGPGAGRTILVEPEDEDKGSLPALFGIPALTYDSSASGLAESLDELCQELHEAITELGSK